MAYFTSAKHFNFVSKTNGTGFLTTGPKTEKNENEYIVVEVGIKEAVKQLSEKKIRASNVLDNLGTLYDIQENVAMALEDAGRLHNYDDDLDNWRAFASLIVSTAISSYSNHSKNVKKD